MQLNSSEIRENKCRKEGKYLKLVGEIALSVTLDSIKSFQFFEN
jgi:hypothetical protein